MTDPRGWVAIVLVAVGLPVAGWVVRLLAGPVFAHELMVLARRGYQPRLRAGLAVILLIVLFIAYAAEFGWDALRGLTPTVDPRSGRFAETFAITTLGVQLLAVVVLTPAIVGATMTEERARGTLDLLRTTNLIDREIVFGKLLARLAVVIGVAVAGLPVLALTLLFGGVDPNRLLIAYGVIVLTAFGLGTASLYLGTVRDELRSVLATVYGVILLFTFAGLCVMSVPGVGGLSPVTLVYWELVREQWPNSGRLAARYWWLNFVVFVLLYGAVGLWFVWLAISRVRTSAIYRIEEPSADRAIRRGYYARRLGDNENPLIWQETVFGNRQFGGGGFQTGCIAFLLFAVGAVLFAGIASSLERWQWIGGSVGRAVRPMLTVASVLLPLALGLRLVGTVAGERDRQTLDALLMLPDDRRHILRAKLAATIDWAKWGIVLLAGLLLMAVMVGGIRVIAGVISAGLLMAVTGGAVGLAAWMTVRQKTGARATVLFLVALLVVYVVPVLLAPASRLIDVESSAAILAASPPVAVWASRYGVTEQAISGLVPAVVYAGIGGMMWRWAERRLEQNEPGA